MRAIKALGNGKAEIQEVPVPKLRPDYITVKTVAVALNPTDWKHIGFLDVAGPTIGCDFAGVVEEVGSAVTKDLKKGDRVFGFAHGGNKVYAEDGAFGDYLTAKGDVVMKIPDGMPFEEACIGGVGLVTVGQGLYQEMNMPWPDPPAEPNSKGFFLVYGASSSMGMWGIQYAKLSGFEVIGVCSPRNFETIKSLGASHVFDYKSATIAKDINKLTNNTLLYAWDTISEGGSAQLCCDALANPAPAGKELIYGTILRVKELPRKDVKLTWSLGYTVKGEAFTMAAWDFPEQPEHFAWGKKITALGEKLLAEGKIKPHPIEVRDGGLESILDGENDLKEGKVSGKKLVYVVGKA